MPGLAFSLSRSLDLALNLLELDSTCRRAGRPLSWHAESVLGPPPRPSAPPGCLSLGIPDDLDAFASRVKEASRQFHVLKLKLGCGDPDFDLKVVATARATAPHTTLLLDVNGGWSSASAPLMIEKVTAHGPALIEQPVHPAEGITAWQGLRARLPAGAPPLYADESIMQASDLPGLAPFVDGVNVKLLKCGGFDAALDLVRAARHHGLGVLIGCMLESSLGITAAAHLAPWADWIDLDGHLHLADDDYDGLRYDAEGLLRMPLRPGIGAILR